MLEAIFGGLFSFAVRIGARLLDAAVDILRDELGVSSRNAGRSFIESSANKLHDIAGEISERQRSLDRRPNPADANAIADLESADLIEVESAETEEGTIPVFVLV